MIIGKKNYQPKQVMESLRIAANCPDEIGRPALDMNIGPVVVPLIPKYVHIACTGQRLMSFCLLRVIGSGVPCECLCCHM